MLSHEGGACGGISAIAQLLPPRDYVDMDGALLISEDIAGGVRLEKGVPVFPETPGPGLTMHRQSMTA
jgi:hypothetical protein